MSRRLSLVVATALLSLCNVGGFAEECPSLLGRWPYGPTFAVAASGDLTLFGNGAVLQIADFSTPDAPEVIGEVALRDEILDVAVYGDAAYVAGKSVSLTIIDLSDPANPVELGSVDTAGEENLGVAVSGSHAYVAAYDAGLRVIDVSNPSNPVEVGAIGTPGRAWDVAVSDGYAYLADTFGSLRVIDVSNPGAPVEVGLIDTLSSPRAVAAQGGYAYVAEFGTGLRVVDVSNPASPVAVGFVETPGAANAVDVSGSHVYLSDGGEGLRIIDVSDPSSPFEAGSFEPEAGFWHGVAVSDGLAFTTTFGSGLRAIDVSNPADPVEVSYIDTPAFAEAVAASGSHAYVASATGLRVFDISTPSSPLDVGSVDIPRGAEAVTVAGDLAYIAHGYFGFTILDVADPSHPAEVAYYDTEGQAVDIAVAGGYAYVAEFGSGLRVMDVSTPSNPVPVGFTDAPVVASSVAVSGNHAYVANANLGFHVIDISVPENPVSVGFLQTPSRSFDVAVEGTHAYVATLDGVVVVDVSTPTAPEEVARVRTPSGDTTSVTIADNYAYAVGPLWGLKVIDISVPSSPLDLGTMYIPSEPLDLAAANGLAVVAEYAAGMEVFTACGEESQSARSSFFPAAAVAAGAEGAFFQTDIEINNTGTEGTEVVLQWLPRGEDNSEPVTSSPIPLAAGHSHRFENVLTEVFGLEPDSLGAVRMLAGNESVIGMSRTYNIPGGKAAGTFGQGLPAIRTADMIAGSAPQRIIFLSEDADSRANVGCVNGSAEGVRINIGLFDDEGVQLETRTMDLGPYSSNQINRVLRNHAPVNGSVDVWADRDDALFYCYGSMLDNETSDPTTVLPQVPSDDVIFIPAAALAAGLEGAFFKTDLDLSNTGSTGLTYELLWLPRGADNSNPIRSGAFSLAPGAGVRYADVLAEVFGLEPDQVGALAIEASGADLLAMSRTYNVPSAKVAGTFGQELPGIPADQMIPAGTRKRIIFMNENDDVRSNVGCVNGSPETARVSLDLYTADGELLETRVMDLAPYSNNQITRVFRNHAPVSAGYVNVWTATPGATIYCYGSVLDNATSDPTTVLPQ